jgi:hypothetical protein
MLEKIISGGQTGADQAALDVAVKYNIPYGGWIPKGRKTEAGPLPSRYTMAVMPTADYRDRTRQNVLDSQGTVILYRRHLTGGSRLTRELVQSVQKPYFAVDLMVFDPFEAAMMLQTFVHENRIRVLNVAGPRASHDPGIYEDVKIILETLVYLLFLEQDEPWPSVFVSLSDLPAGAAKTFPQTKDAAVSLLMADLSLKIKANIARLDPEDIRIPYFSWLDHLRNRLGLDGGNTDLVEACRRDAGLAYFNMEDAVMEIIKAVKASCDEAFRLRVVR